MSDSTSRTRHTEDGIDGRRRLIRVVIAIAILLLLSACCWTLMWPVPKDVLDGESFERGSVTVGGLRVSNLKASTLKEPVAPRKGAFALVSFDVVAASGDAPFDISFISLQLDSITLPPVEGGDFRRWTEVPSMLASGRSESVSVVFAVPEGSMDATLTVRTSRLSDATAPRLPFRLDTSGGAR